MNARVQAIQEMHVCTHAPSPSKLEQRAAIERDMAAFEASGGYVTELGGFEWKPLREGERKPLPQDEVFVRAVTKPPRLYGHMNMFDAADFLGMHRGTLFKHVKAGAIRAAVIEIDAAGRHNIGFDLADLLKYKARGGN